MALLYFLVFTIGASLGSFANVLILRLDKKEGILAGRSECPDCHHFLNWKDLFPIFSYILLRGKCRYCGDRISVQYPAVEFIFGFIFMTYFIVNGFSIGVYEIYSLIAIFIMLVLLFFDYFFYILPDKLTFSGIGLALVHIGIFRTDQLWSHLLSGFGLAVLFAIIYLASCGKWMGFGDVKLALFIGLILGYPMGLLSIMFAIWAGAISGLVLVALSRANLKTAMPFGSFMTASAIFFIVFKDYVRGITKFF